MKTTSSKAPSLSEAFREALQHHQSGRLSEAERLYRAILAVDSRHADALHLLGLIAHQVGRNEIAADLIENAIGINREEAIYRANLGLVLRRGGRPDDALAACNAAILIRPDYRDALNARGLILSDLGRWGSALTAYDMALRSDPNFAEAHYNRGNVLRDLGQPYEALQAFEAALRIKSDFAEAHVNRSIVLRSLGRLDDALASVDAAIHAMPEYAEAHSNRGNVLRDLDRFQDALASYARALCLNPDYAEAYANRGGVLINIGRPESALASFDAAICIRPDNPVSWSNRGSALKELALLDEALGSYEAALRLKPDFAIAHSNLIMNLHYRERTAGGAILAAAQDFGSRFGSDVRRPSFPNPPDTERRLRIGYVSGDFGRHPVGYFLAPVLANHDHSKVEIFCYSTAVHDDDLTGTLRAASDHWRCVMGLGDERAADLIRSDAIDILVDLSGHTAENRLPMFSHRPAPVQATWLGYWGTTGLSAMDYILSDEAAIPPEEESCYVERVIRLPNSRFCYSPPGYAPEPAEPPCRRNGFVTFGSFNNLSKVGPDVVKLWASVLLAVPGSRLLLKWKSLSEENARRRVMMAFACEGVAADRLILRGASKHADMLAEYADMDIALDPFPFTGGLTSCEALWMGVPVVTLPGSTAPSRQTFGFLKTLGLTQWVASNIDEYVSIAASFAADIDALMACRRDLRARMAASPLCDGAAFARDLETAFRTMWRNWCRERGC